jgi:hypothetical protein
MVVQNQLIIAMSIQRIITITIIFTGLLSIVLSSSISQYQIQILPFQWTPLILWILLTQIKLITIRTVRLLSLRITSLSVKFQSQP